MSSVMFCFKLTSHSCFPVTDKYLKLWTFGWVSFSSVSRVLRQIVVGWPLLCLINACLEGSSPGLVLQCICGLCEECGRSISTCILWSLMASIMGLCDILCHRSWLEVCSGHVVCRIWRRQELIKTCSLCCKPLVCFQVFDIGVEQQTDALV